MSTTAPHCVIVTEPNTEAFTNTRPRRRWLLAAIAGATILAGALAGVAIYNRSPDAGSPPPDNRMLPWIWTSDDPATAAPAGGAAESPAPAGPTKGVPANPDPTRRATLVATPTPAVQQPSPTPSKASPRPREPPTLTPPPT